jgi:hypothetical protein
MYAQQMAKGKAALQRGAYSDILSKSNFPFPFDLQLFNPGAYVYGLNRTIPTTYAGPIYPFSPGMFFVLLFISNRNRIIFSAAS